MGPGDLSEAICGLPLLSSPDLIRGMGSLDDAGVYKLTGDLALIQTIDFFTPIVDDPYLFGQIAIANALSDVYAMGGKPLLGMNIVCFPSKTMDIEVLKSILRGGADKMREAGVILVGGHSIDDAELKYGLSVTGIVHPGKLVTNSGAEVGDMLILTKPLGSGIISTALKAGVAGGEVVNKVTKYMTALNAEASGMMQEVGVHACTDITGFGLIGHACQLAGNSHAGIKIHFSDVPIFDEALEFSKQGFTPGGLHRNRDFYSPKVKISNQLPDFRQDILFDPQTSGGLLISLDSSKAGLLLEKLGQAGVMEAALIGEVVAKSKELITVD